MPGTTNTLLNFYDLRNELFTADALNTPLLTMSGGLTGGLRTDNFDFPTSVNYALPAAAQNTVSEVASLGAPAATQVVRTQVLNTCQIHHYAIQVSYKHLASMGRLSGIATANVTPNVQDEVDFQIARHLEVIARDVEFSMIQGQFVAAANAGVVAQTRGITGAAGACALAGGIRANAAAPLTLPIMQAFFLQMYNNGAPFNNLVLYTGGRLKQVLSTIYGFAPTSRNVGGVNIEQLVTDFGNIGVVTSRFAPANTIAAVEMSVVAPVFQVVPDKGTIFYEELGRAGGGVQGQIYGIIGFDHGPAQAHGELFNIG
jgi:hypothetical protein